jgi:transcriptional regulator with XRE-family HTH domain
MVIIGFSERVEELLKALGVTQSVFSAQIGLFQGVISEFANGAMEPSKSKDFIFKLSKLGVSLD